MFTLNPEYKIFLVVFGEGREGLVGCCGNTPEHIAAIVKAVKKQHVA